MAIARNTTGAPEAFDGTGSPRDMAAGLAEHYQRALQVLRDVRHMLPSVGVELVDKVLAEVKWEAEATSGPSLLALLDYEADLDEEASLLVTHDHIFGNWQGLKPPSK